MLEQLGHEIRQKMNTNALKTIHFQLAYSSFQSFLVPFQIIISPKCTILS
jgi:hypothetical protein